MKKAAALLLALGSVFSPARRLARKGTGEYRAKRFSEAQSDFRGASAREPEEKTWNYDLGTAQAAGGDLRGARDQLARAASSEDRALSARSLYQLGTLDLQSGNSGDAATELRRSLELDPGNPDAKRNFEIALRSRKQPPQKPPRPEPNSTAPSPGAGKGRGPDDSEFQRKAGMSRAEAEAILRSLENEQKQKERVPAREMEKDW